MAQACSLARSAWELDLGSQMIATIIAAVAIAPMPITATTASRFARAVQDSERTASEVELRPGPPMPTVPFARVNSVSGPL